VAYTTYDADEEGIKYPDDLLVKAGIISGQPFITVIDLSQVQSTLRLWRS
jgi:hypothetical protein